MSLAELAEALDRAEAYYVSATVFLMPVHITKKQALQAINDTLDSRQTLKISCVWFGDRLSLFLGAASGEEVKP